MAARWIVSGRTRSRLTWSLVALAGVAAVVVWSVVDAVREPSVPSVVLASILLATGAGAFVLAGEAVTAGLVRVDADGYRVPLGPPRRWADVLAVGSTAQVGGAVPTVALRDTADPLFGVASDTFPGFTDADADALLAEFRQRTPAAPDAFSGVVLPDAWWAEVEAEADRVREAVVAASGRRPVAESRVELGYPGLASALLLDYGRNDAGEGVQVLVRRASDLAIVRDGVRYLRQARRRTPDAAAEVGPLFGPHTTAVLPATALGFAQAVVTVEGRRPLRFNEEEPDRFR